MQDELEDNHKDYSSRTHEEWCDLLSTIDIKDNSKGAEAQINGLATPKSEPVNSYTDEYVSVPCNNRARTGVLPNQKQQG